MMLTKSKIQFLIAIAICGKANALTLNNIPESCKNFEKYDSFFSNSININGNFSQFINNDYNAGGAIKIDDKDFIIDYNDGEINAKFYSSGKYMIYFDRSLNQKSHIPKTKIQIYSILSSKQNLSTMKILECRIFDGKYEIEFDKVKNLGSLTINFIEQNDALKLKEISQTSGSSDSETKIILDY